MSAVIRLDRVSKRYPKYRSIVRSTTVKTAFLDWLRGRQSASPGPAEFELLHDVSFGIERGETFGLIGRNGAGKSTLLKMIAGIYRPESGTVEVDGRVAALIELGAGFHPEFTGMENIVMNGMMLGLTRKQIEERVDAIVEFSGIGDFVEAPVRTYSSGMYARLAFSVAVHVDPDILLVDEILGVGDETFAAKCQATLEERLASRRQTTVIVSHDLGLLGRLCDRIALVDPPSVTVFTSAAEAIEAYHTRLYGNDRAHAAPPTLEALESDLGEIARLLKIEPASGAGGAGVSAQTDRGRAIIEALRAAGLVTNP